MDQSIINKCFDFADSLAHRVGGTASWCVFDKDCRVSQNMIYGSACNSGIRAGEFVLGFQTYGAGAKEELGIRFYDWLFNRSWAAPFIQRPSDSDGRELAILLSGELPSNWLVAILQLYRVVREHGRRLPLMFEFVDKGCPEDLAFLCAFSFHGSDWPSINTNHNSIAPIVPRYWHNFVNHDIVKKHEPFNKSSAYLGGIMSMWGPAAEFNDPSFGKKLLAYLPKKGEVKMDRVIVPNPFVPVVKSSGADVVTVENIRAVLPEIIETFKQGEVGCKNDLLKSA